jgi:hypothetical protein
MIFEKSKNFEPFKAELVRLTIMALEKKSFLFFKKRLTVFLLSIILIVSTQTLLGCMPPKEESVGCSVTSNTSTSKVDKPLNIQVFVDGTLSMSGFTSIPDSNYINILNYLEILSSLWSKSGIDYSRYTDGGQEKISIRQAQRKGFYIPNIDSKLASVIPKPEAKENDLVVIVTDLGEKDQQVTDAINALGQHLDKANTVDMGIGIIGIKSQFYGQVFDVGVDNQNFEWDTRNKEKDQWRPFYLIVIGSRKNILTFHDDLKSKNQWLNNNLISNSSLLWSSVRDKIARADTKQLRLVSNDGKKITVDNINKDGVQISRKIDNAQYVSQFAVSRGSIYDIEYIIPIKDSLTALDVSTQTKITSKLNLEKFDTKNRKFQTFNSNAITLNQKQDNLDTYTMSINSNSLQSGVYHGEFLLTPSEQGISFVRPIWWEQWSARNVTLEGSRTDNLQKFMDGLQSRLQANTKDDNLVLGKVCFVIQSN